MPGRTALDESVFRHFWKHPRLLYVAHYGMLRVMMVDTHRAMNRTDRDVLQALEARWDAYHRALRSADQAAFDRLFEHAQAHATASSAYADVSEGQHPQYLEQAALVSILIEQQTHIDDLEDRLDHLETDLNDKG